jgi:IS30 family transposase
MQEQAEAKLKEGWSPEQIAGRFKAEGIPVVSHQRIYECIMDDRLDGGSLYMGRPHEDKFETITYDNGMEFAAHATVVAALCATIFFANPYRSWERGLNENTNGLIRQYIPKKAMLSGYSAEDIRIIRDAINNRPRKTLGFFTPHEVFIEGKNNLKIIGGCT